jgi:hypothetical protein
MLRAVRGMLRHHTVRRLLYVLRGQSENNGQSLHLAHAVIRLTERSCPSRSHNAVNAATSPAVLVGSRRRPRWSLCRALTPTRVLVPYATVAVVMWTDASSRNGVGPSSGAVGPAVMAERRQGPRLFQRNLILRLLSKHVEGTEGPGS